MKSRELLKRSILFCSTVFLLLGSSLRAQENNWTDAQWVDWIGLHANYFQTTRAGEKSSSPLNSSFISLRTQLDNKNVRWDELEKASLALGRFLAGLIDDPRYQASAIHCLGELFAKNPKVVSGLKGIRGQLNRELKKTFENYYFDMAQRGFRWRLSPTFAATIYVFSVIDRKAFANILKTMDEMQHTWQMNEDWKGGDISGEVQRALDREAAIIESGRAGIEKFLQRQGKLPEDLEAVIGSFLSNLKVPPDSPDVRKLIGKLE